MPGVEFLDTDGDGRVPDDDADALETGPRRPPRRVVPAVAALVLAVAAVVLLARVGRDGGSTPRAAPTSVPATSSSPSDAAIRSDPPLANPPPVQPAPVTGRSSFEIVVIDCPDLDACTVDLSTPTPVQAALRARLGPVDDVQVDTVLVKGTHPVLRSRHVTASLAGGGVDVEVTVAGASSPERRPQGGRAVAVTVQQGGYDVAVTVVGPRAPAVVALSRLAADPRLVAVS